MNPQDDLDRMLQGDDQPGSPAKQDQGVDLQQQRYSRNIPCSRSYQTPKVPIDLYGMNSHSG